MRGFRKLGLYVLGVIIFTASHAQAAPFTGAMEGFWTVNYIYGPDGTFLYAPGTTTAPWLYHNGWRHDVSHNTDEF